MIKQMISSFFNDLEFFFSVINGTLWKNIIVKIKLKPASTNVIIHEYPERNPSTKKSRHNLVITDVQKTKYGYIFRLSSYKLKKERLITKKVNIDKNVYAPFNVYVVIDPKNKASIATIDLSFFNKYTAAKNGKINGVISDKSNALPSKKPIIKTKNPHL